MEKLKDELRQSSHYILFVFAFLILALTFITIPRRVFASNPNNGNSTQIKFKTSKKNVDKVKKSLNNTDGFTSVVVVDSPASSSNSTVNTSTSAADSNGAANGNPVISNGNKTNNAKNIKSSKSEVNPAPQKIAKNIATNRKLEESGLLAKKGDFKNYQKNINHIFPMIINRKIVHYIHFYQTAGREFFKYALSRSERYMPMIKKVFSKLGIPNDLAYLAMIESGFSPTAYSYAGASGMWQFIPSTGRLFGLTINWWVDERRNPVESTYAAGEFLKELFNKFGSWYLAAAAYNSGELTIERALSTYPGGNFWTISQNKPYLLPGQTRRYVPKIIAAAIIAKDPANFGFHNIQYKNPITFKQVRIPFSVSLFALAKCADITEFTLRKMNPELLRDVTPPNDPNFMLNVPADKYKMFVKNFKNIQKYINSEPKVTYASYKRLKGNLNYTVEPGDTLMGIALKYGISLGVLERYNRLNNYSVLRIGERIVVPGTRRNNTIKEANSNFMPAYIIVRHGMTLWSISLKYKVSLNILRRVNHINGNDIHPGEKLFIKNSNVSNIKYSYVNKRYLRANGRLARPAGRLLYYKVRFGESLYSIASRFHDNVKNIMAYNHIKNPNAIYPGEIIKIN